MAVESLICLGTAPAVWRDRVLLLGDAMPKERWPLGLNRAQEIVPFYRGIDGEKDAALLETNVGAVAE